MTSSRITKFYVILFSTFQHKDLVFKYLLSFKSRNSILSRFILFEEYDEILLAFFEIFDFG